VSVTAYIGLGGNLGDPADRLRAAAQDLAAIPQTQLKHVSSLYRSPPLGPPDQPHYVNAVAALETALPPDALLDALQALEVRHGRVRDGQRWGPRTLDLDLLLYGDAQLATPRLTVPHPGLPRRAFVLYPLAEIAPDLQVPGWGGVQALLAQWEAPPGAEITPALIGVLEQIKAQIQSLDEQIAQSDRLLAQTARHDPVARLLHGIHGVGPTIATAVLAQFGTDLRRFADARQFAASLGVTPSEHSSGQTRRLGGITKRGNPYLRRLLVQGAQSVVNHRARRDDPISQLAQRLVLRKTRNAAVVAVANRLARIIYAVIQHREPYRYGSRAVAAV